MQCKIMQHLSRIFPQNKLADEKKIVQLPSTNKNVTIFIGPPNICKTSILFQASVSFGYEGKHVVFICKDVFRRIPVCVHGMPKPNADIMKHLKILYMSSSKELINYLSSIHTSPVVPDVLVINDIDFYATQQSDKALYGLSRLCAIIEDTVSYLTVKSQGNFDALLSSSDTNANHGSIYSRYFADVFQISKTSEDIYECTRAESVKNSQPIKISYRCTEECLLSKDMYVGSKDINSIEENTVL